LITQAYIFLIYSHVV